MLSHYPTQVSPSLWNSGRSDFGFMVSPSRLCNTHLLICIGAKSLDLSWHVDYIKDKCYDWEGYQKELSALHIDHIRKYVQLSNLASYVMADVAHSFQLPDDVFVDGDVKPSRPQRKKSSANGNSKKRQASGVCRRVPSIYTLTELEKTLAGKCKQLADNLY